MNAPAPKTEMVDHKALEAELAKYAQDASALEKPIGGAISFRAGQISWQGNPVPNNKLPCVVIGFINENRWYDKPFDSDHPANPACFAIGETEESMAPHEDSEKPQGGPDKKCAGCPKSAWGSGMKNGLATKGKACSEMRRLALIPATALTTHDAILASEIAIAKLPVTSVRFWSAYVNRLSSVLKRPPFGVFTEISTEPHPKHQFHVHFNAINNVPLELMASVMKKREMAQAYLDAPYTSDGAAAEEDPKAKSPKKF